jgi:hypothetical protein
MIFWISSGRNIPGAPAFMLVTPLTKDFRQGRVCLATAPGLSPVFGGETVMWGTIEGAVRQHQLLVSDFEVPAQIMENPPGACGRRAAGVSV